MKVLAVIALKAQYRLDVLLDVAGLARSTFFYRQAQLRRPDPKAALKAAVTRAFENNHRRYVHRVLVDEGWRVAKKTVLAVMRELGLACRVRHRRRYVSYQGQVGAVAANILDRQFTAATPNEKWVTDVTEFRVGEAKLYLSPVMDLFDRQIISYSIGKSPTTEFTNRSLRAALGTLGEQECPIVHSDQGFHYQHSSWRRLLADAGAIQSMSRKANCYDNAIIENFFGHLKEEMFHHVRYSNLDALHTAIEDYIDWFNNDRISLRLDGLSPVRYRAQALAA
ncbi:IS3 family transposase [Rhodococcus sp. ARC_M5]|uniref:IS3 family transposase n=2 Tax=Rhodococcus sp. ARC_M5 TaxID=2928851 RepID=UPI001FB3A506|nr:IS3 family transposase [Rhodococcus sp. ARC_M5]MCJ0894083.1 IS3 family transposase [Rhodococcus sp. ARC_M5]